MPFDLKPFQWQSNFSFVRKDAFQCGFLGIVLFFATAEI